MATEKCPWSEHYEIFGFVADRPSLEGVRNFVR
jgi:hypothetical protein